MALAVLWSEVGLHEHWLLPLDREISDSFSRWENKAAADGRIVIVDINEETLKVFGQWPWPRAQFAALLSGIVQDHPAGVGVDVLFPERRDDSDDALLSVVKKSPTCLAVALDFNPKNSRVHVGNIGKPPPLPSDIQPIQALGFVGNFEALSQVARCVGQISPLVDEDGVIRRVPVWAEVQGQSVPTLSLAMLQQLGASSVSLEQAVVRVPYRVALDKWVVVPASAVLYGQLEKGFFENKWVLVGSSAMGLGDRVTTPIHPWLPGVLIHAELLNEFLQGWPQPWQSMALWSRVLAVFFSLSVAVLLLQGRLSLGLALALCLSGIWLVLAKWGWELQSVFSLSLPWVAIWGTVVLVAPLQWAWALQHSRKVARLFKGYLAPELVDALVASPEGVLMPQRRILTVLFADVAGFTKLSRMASPEFVAKMVRDVLEVLTECALQYEGTVDKYIGDEIMVFWNAPFDQADHRDRSFACALEMLAAIERFNALHPQYPDVTIFIGIGTGEALVGDLGTQFRHAYTAVGYGVNEAHKLTIVGKKTKKMVVMNWSCFKGLKLQKAVEKDSRVLVQNFAGNEDKVNT